MMQDLTLATLIIWTFISFGITLSITRGAIFRPLRERVLKLNATLGQLISCPMCFSFWVGLTMSLLWQSLSGNCILDAFYCLSTNTLLYFWSWNLALREGV